MNDILKSMKADEAKLLVMIADPVRPCVRDIVCGLHELGFMHYKRAWRILEKWTDRDWYEYGVTLDLGWLTATGMAAATSKSITDLSKRVDGWVPSGHQVTGHPVIIPTTQSEAPTDAPTAEDPDGRKSSE